MNQRNLFATAASLFASLLSACADPPPLYGDKPVTSSGENMPPPVTVKPDMAESPYPGGPYGSQPGDTMFDIDLPGYRLDLEHTDSTALAWEDHITLSSVRSRSNAKCIWLQLDAFW